MMPSPIKAPDAGGGFCLDTGRHRPGTCKFSRYIPTSAMNSYKLWSLVAAALLWGCASDRFRSGDGEVGQFILQKAVAAGATPVSTNALLRVSRGWRYFEDADGVVIHLAPADYPALESFLIKTFGPPKVGPQDTPSGGRYGTYRLTTKGGVLQFGRDSEDGTHVEIIRPLTRQEARDGAMRAIADPQVRDALTKP